MSDYGVRARACTDDFDGSTILRPPRPCASSFLPSFPPSSSLCLRSQSPAPAYVVFLRQVVRNEARRKGRKEGSREGRKEGCNYISSHKAACFLLLFLATPPNRDVVQSLYRLFLLLPRRSLQASVEADQRKCGIHVFPLPPPSRGCRVIA